jgi:hypothetical protein
MERGDAHPHVLGELGDDHRSAEVGADEGDGARDGARVAVVADQPSQHAAKGRRQQAVVDLPRDHGREDPRVGARVGEREVAAERVEERRGRGVRLESTRFFRVEGRCSELVIQAAEHVELDVEQQRQVGRLCDAGDHGQVVAHQQALTRAHVEGALTEAGLLPTL